MKCNPWRWLWGLIPILMLGWIAILGEREHIETDLVARTTAALERKGYSWASVQFDGRDAVLSGRAIDDSERPLAATVALETMGVRIVDNRASLVDKAVTYEWGAVRKEDRIRVSGLVPSDKSRRDVIGIVKANFPSLEVDDRMKLARGSPPIDVWLGGVGFGLKQLALLREGRVELENASISVGGTARDAGSYRAVKAALSGQMPQGIRLKTESVRPPPASPFTWVVRRQGDEWTMLGHVPSDGVHDDLLRAARRVAPKAKIVDRTEPASGAPGRFAEAANALILELGHLEEAEARIRDNSLSLNGVAQTSARAEQVTATMRQGVLAAFKASGEIRHREPAVKTISPYQTSASVEPGKVTLSGYVPDDKARAAVIALARRKFGGSGVSDQLEVGVGQPPGWQQCLDAGLDALQKLGGGRATLTDRRLEVSGTTVTEALAQSLPATVSAAAGPACDTSVRLDLAAIQATEDTRRQAADAAAKADEERRRSDQMARLETERRQAEEARKRQALQDERRRQAAEERERAEAAARQKAEAEARQQAAAERERSEAAARLKAESAARLKAEAERRRQVETERRRDEVAARQKAEAEARQKAEAERIARLPEVEKKQVIGVCQEALSRVVREGIINFNRASYDLDPTSYPTLNKVADAANRCPALTVEIEGHTDAEGTPARNKRLSERRANTVREYLSRAGVEPSRLEALGFGETRPIATNDTQEGRAKNRRIEFVVKLKQ
ncbi:MAG: OmpA family protein [Hyphomicrobiaceae bacterium]